MFKRKPHLKRHQSMHREERPYRCTFEGCGKSFPSNQKLAKHTRSHNMYCGICSMSFRKRADFDLHQRAHEASSGSSSKLQCPECKKEVDASQLQRHMKRHRLPALKKHHACDQCEEQFVRFKDLVKHKRSQHPSKKLLCPDCGKAYARLGHLHEHQRRVHGEELLLCPRADCGQTFTSASNLYQHERVVHLGLKPFTCNDCGQTFAYRHVLRRHRMVVHNVIALKNASAGQSKTESQPPLLSMSAAFSRSACSCADDSCQHAAAAAASSAPAVVLGAGRSLVARHQAKRRRLMSRFDSESEAQDAGSPLLKRLETEGLGEMIMF